MAIIKYWIAVLLIAIAALAAYALWPKEAHTTPTAVMHTVTVGTTVFNVEVADTEALRELGLGVRSLLPAGHGMLFVFDKPAVWGIWMKDMHFPLDIIWARADGTITTVARDVATSTYPDVFYSKTPDAMYVVEVNAGAATGIAEGSRMLIGQN